MSSLVGKLHEVGNIGIDIPIFYFQLSQLIIGFFMSGIVYKGLLEFFFHDLPFVHLPGKEGGVLHDIFKPFILHFDPSLGVHTFKEGEEVIALLERVIGYIHIYSCT